MVRFIEFCESRSPNGIPPEEFHCFGDWLNIKAETPKEVIYTAYFALSTRIVAQAAEALGKDGSNYWSLYEKIKEAFAAHYRASSTTSLQLEGADVDDRPLAAGVAGIRLRPIDEARVAIEIEGGACDDAVASVDQRRVRHRIVIAVEHRV